MKKEDIKLWKIDVDTLEFLNNHCQFENENEVYILLAIARKKDNPLTNSEEIVFREVIRNKDNITKKYYKIKALTENYYNSSYNFYVYISLNPRDSMKAFFNLKHAMLVWVEEALNTLNDINHVKNIANVWLSFLMKKTARSRKLRWLIDFDSNNKAFLDTTISKLEKYTEIERIIKTPNGYHILIKPFNTKLLDEFFDNNKDIISVEKDRVVFCRYIRGKK